MTNIHSLMCLMHLLLITFELNFHHKVYIYYYQGGWMLSVWSLCDFCKHRNQRPHECFSNQVDGPHQHAQWPGSNQNWKRKTSILIFVSAPQKKKKKTLLQNNWQAHMVMSYDVLSDIIGNETRNVRLYTDEQLLEQQKPFSSLDVKIIHDIWSSMKTVMFAFWNLNAKRWIKLFVS